MQKYYCFFIFRRENIVIVKHDCNSGYVSKVIEAFEDIYQMIQEKKDKQKKDKERQEEEIMFLFYFTGHNDREGLWLGNDRLCSKVPIMY